MKGQDARLLAFRAAQDLVGQTAIGGRREGREAMKGQPFMLHKFTPKPSSPPPFSVPLNTPVLKRVVTLLRTMDLESIALVEVVARSIKGLFAR